MIHSHKLSADPFTDPFSVPLPAQTDAAARARSLLELRRRAFGNRHTIEVALNSIGSGHPFEISYQAQKAAKWFNSDRVVILVKFFLVCALIVAFLLILSTFFPSLGHAKTPEAVPTFAPIVSVTPIVTQSDQSVSQFDTPTATPQTTADPTATVTHTPQSFSNLPACLTVSDIFEIEHTAQGEALGLHNTAAMYFVMGQMLFDKAKTDCQPLYRWFAHDNAQAKVKITQDTMNAWAKLAADYPGLYFGYCGQVGSEDDFNAVWLPQRLTKKLPLLRLDYAFASSDGTSMELAFNCVPPLGK